MIVLISGLGISILDLVLAVFLILSVLGGVLKGVIRSISWLPGIVLGFLSVHFFTKPLAAIIIENSVLTPLWATYISVILLMGGVYLVIRLLACIFASFLEEVGLSAIDKILGGLFSLCLCLIIIGVLAAAVDGIPVFSSLRPHLDSSFIVKHIIRPFYSGTVGFVKGSL